MPSDRSCTTYTQAIPNDKAHLTERKALMLCRLGAAPAGHYVRGRAGRRGSVDGKRLEPNQVLLVKGKRRALITHNGMYCIPYLTLCDTIYISTTVTQRAESHIDVDTMRYNSLLSKFDLLDGNLPRSRRYSTFQCRQSNRSTSIITSTRLYICILRFAALRFEHRGRIVATMAGVGGPS
jgi:hypothetical protein